MVWWVLSQGVSGPTVSLLVLCIFLPLNIGVLLTGVAVDRFGSRRLLIVSKLIATCGALACFLLLATNAMTLVILAILAIVTYGAMSPSISADISRVPAITKLAGRRLESFHAANGIVMVAGQMIGLIGAGLLWDATGPAAAVGLGTLLVLISTAFTWFGFPRDRVGPRSPLSAFAQVPHSGRSGRFARQGSINGAGPCGNHGCCRNGPSRAVLFPRSTDHSPPVHRADAPGHTSHFIHLAGDYWLLYRRRRDVSRSRRCRNIHDHGPTGTHADIPASSGHRIMGVSGVKRWVGHDPIHRLYGILFALFHHIHCIGQHNWRNFGQSPTREEKHLSANQYHPQKSLWMLQQTWFKI